MFELLTVGFRTSRQAAMELRQLRAAHGKLQVRGVSIRQEDTACAPLHASLADLYNQLQFDAQHAVWH